MSNFAGAVVCGPSPTKSSTTSPPTTASPDTNRTFERHTSLPTALTRYGEAFPKVSAPTSTPKAVPRPRRNHVAIIFIPGGYTPARHTPTKKRSTTPVTKSDAKSPNAALTTAPAKADSANNFRELITSGRFSSALKSVPATKPNCTASVSQPAADSDRLHSARSAGTTAEAENHRDMQSNSAAPSRASARQRPAPSTISVLSTTAPLKLPRTLSRFDAREFF